jgi:hypothetical protein
MVAMASHDEKRLGQVGKWNGSIWSGGGREKLCGVGWVINGESKNYEQSMGMMTRRAMDLF